MMKFITENRRKGSIVRKDKKDKGYRDKDNLKREKLKFGLKSLLKMLKKLVRQILIQNQQKIEAL